MPPAGYWDDGGILDLVLGISNNLSLPPPNRGGNVSHIDAKTIPDAVRLINTKIVHNHRRLFQRRLPGGLLGGLGTLLHAIKAPPIMDEWAAVFTSHRLYLHLNRHSQPPFLSPPAPQRRRGNRLRLADGHKFQDTHR